MVKRKLRAGVGAKASILTKFIHPKQQNGDATHRSNVILISKEERKVNRKNQVCYTFCMDGDDRVMYAVERYFKILEEGNKEGYFVPLNPAEEAAQKEAKVFKEPKTKWRKSKAKMILYEALLDSTVPLDDKRFEAMSLEDIYSIDPELSLYDFAKFKDRLNRLRDKVMALDKRADEDLAAFQNYKKNHSPSLFSHKGYIQWQGSSAQEYLWEDLDAYMKDPNMKPSDLWKSRPEYMNEFPLQAFSDKIKQEIRTAKYLKTVKERGQEHRAS